MIDVSQIKGRKYAPLSVNELLWSDKNISKSFIASNRDNFESACIWIT